MITVNSQTQTVAPPPGQGGNLSGAKGLVAIRDMRYQRDQLPQKWRQAVSGDFRFRSRLTHNEILRVVSLLGRNPPRATVPATSESDKDAKAADNQTRWLNNLLPALERRANLPLTRMFDDALCESGLGAFEFYLNDNYDKVSLEQLPAETDGQYLRRTESALRNAGLPFGLRVLDPLSLLFLTDDDGICAVMIVEKKNRRILQRQLSEQFAGRQLDPDDPSLPRPGDPGWPLPDVRNRGRNDVAGDTETLRYYDRRWYVYMVDGKIIERKPHGFPQIPVIISYGITTSSSNASERMEGITWGMTDIEQGVNDLLTLQMDVAFAYNRPAPVVETDKDSEVLNDAQGNPVSIRLGVPGEAPQLLPGQHIADAYGQFRSHIDPGLVQEILGMWQRSGLNPISQGDSPGSSPAGYTVNTLQTAAQSMYEILLDNKARGLGMLYDLVRQTIKHTVKETCYLALGSGANVEWLGLGPDDITDVPCEVAIDPMSDVNRLAIRQSLIDGNRSGYIPRSMVQKVGFGIDDPDDADDEIVRDLFYERYANMTVDQAIATLSGQAPGQPAGPPGAAVPPGPAGPATANGAVPAPPNPPTVGGEITGAQGVQQQGPNGAGPAVGSEARGRAGQQPSSQPTAPARGAQ